MSALNAAARKAVDARAFLNVDLSLTGKRWAVREADDKLAEAHRRQSLLPEIAARLLAARGVSIEQAKNFLNPTLRDFFPDPSTFKDMDLAAKIIDEAIASGKPTAVFADYDVDGGTSAALLVRYFRARGRKLTIYVPDRMAEGYGPSPIAFDRLKAMGIELCITVDCGGVSYGPLEHAASIGLEMIVVDHHLMHGPPPLCLACVNPNRMDDTSGQGHLTAAGVVLVLLAALNRQAKKAGTIGANNLPDLMGWLDLSALGTVCDVAPLTGFNRAVVAQGLKVLSRKENIGIAALALVAKREKLGQVYDLGFVLGPRLNAGGRVGDSSLAARLLSTEDPIEAADVAEQLDALNVERKKYENDMLAIATEEADAMSKDLPIAIVGRPEWHPGVIGIAAGRLKERLMKPVIVLGGEGDYGKGSGRSITGVNLGAAVAAAAKAGILVAGGGHAMAAGLTVEWTKVDEFRAFMAEALMGELAAAAGEARTLWIDAIAGLPAVDLPLMDAIDRIGPYGPGHVEPVFALADVSVSYSSQMKGDHVRCVLQSAGGRKLRAIAFRAATNPLGEALLKRDQKLHVAVKLKRDSYGGTEKVEAEILDGALA